MVDKENNQDEYQFDEHDEEEASVVTTTKPMGVFESLSLRKKIIIGVVLVLVVFAVIRVMNRTPETVATQPSTNSAAQIQAAMQAKNQARLAQEQQAAQEAAEQAALDKKQRQQQRLDAVEALATANQNSITALQANLAAQTQTLNQINDILQDLKKSQDALKADLASNKPAVVQTAVQGMVPGMAWISVQNKGLMALHKGDEINTSLGKIININTDTGVVTTESADREQHYINYGISYGKNMATVTNKTGAE